MSGTVAEPRVLVVDDDVDVRPLAESALRPNGFEVIFTADPTKAVGLAREHRPVLVLCDITMPVMDGYSVLRALQADPASASCPVVFLTASRQPLDRVRAFRFGVVGYLTKPIEPAQLGREVVGLLKTLPERRGSLRGDGGQVLDELRRAARSGVLKVEQADGARALAVRHGEPTGDTAATSAPVEFRELDPTRDEIVLPGDAGLPPGEGLVPGFDEIPEGLRRVLLLDHDDAFRRVLGRALAAHGLTVYAAADAVTGLRLALEHRPWLLVADVRLPEAGAFDFLRAVRGHSLLGRVPLVLLSGWDDFKARLQGLSTGVADYVAKQSPLREILFRLQVVLRRHVLAAEHGHVLAGDLEALGAPGALQMAHMARLSGLLRASDGTRKVEVRFHQGEIVSARCGESTGESALFDFIAWEHGSFSFVPGAAPHVERLGQGFEQLLLEGCRRLDESRRAPDDDPRP